MNIDSKKCIVQAIIEYKPKIYTNTFCVKNRLKHCIVNLNLKCFLNTKKEFK